MYQPLISVILPTFNGATYLAKSIESVLNQTYRHLELIIVDDASTDDTSSIIAKYGARDSRVRSIRNQLNRKLPASLNIGFSDAGGVLFTWTSDDNLYQPHALAEMRAFLEDNPGTDMVYADCMIIDEGGAVIEAKSTGPTHCLPLGNNIAGCFLYRRALHEKLEGYAEDMYLVEDYDFWLRASISHRIEKLEKNLYLYRRHGKSLTETRFQEVRKAHERCVLKNLPRLTWVSNELRRKAYSSLIYLAMERHDRRSAFTNLLRGLLSNPLIIWFEIGVVAYLILPLQARRLINWDEPWLWLYRVEMVSYQIRRLIPSGNKFILIDDGQLPASSFANRNPIPFIEQDGKYWGPPSDDDSAVKELERERHGGARYVVFAWPAFWWLEYYSEFNHYLRSKFHCIEENDIVVIFDLA